MSWSSRIASVLFFFIVGCSWADATGPCPLVEGQPLRFVDVFDGAPAELALLAPDIAQERSGNWTPGYVYDAGRFVTLRCKYADGRATDIKLASKVRRCDYRIDKKQTLSLSCK